MRCLRAMSTKRFETIVLRRAHYPCVFVDRLSDCNVYKIRRISSHSASNLCLPLVYYQEFRHHNLV